MSLTKSLLLSSILFLTGCSMFGNTVTQTELIQKEIPIVPQPEPLNLKPIQWKIITKNNVNSFLEGLQSEQVYVIMTVNDYETLAVNMADIKQYLQEQKRIIVYYEQSITNN